MRSRKIDEAVVAIPEVPVNVSFSDLDEDGFLLDKHTRDKMLADPNLALVNNGRIKKNELRDHLNENLAAGEAPHEVKYDVLKIDGEYYALYKGVSHSKQKGTGSSGVAKSAQNLRTGNWIVPKFVSEIHHLRLGIRKKRNPKWIDKQKAEALAEYEINKKMGLNIGSKPLPERVSPKKGKQFVIPLADAGMDLRSYYVYLRAGGIKLHPSQLTDMMIQIAVVLNKLHTELNMVHRDFKLENLLINPYTGKITLTDFGFAALLPPDGVLRTKDVMGTQYTMAPESMNAAEYSAQSDAFSLGATLAEFFDMLQPEVSGEPSILKNLSEVIKEPGAYDKETMEWVYQLAGKLMQTDPKKRATIPDTIQALTNRHNEINLTNPLTIGTIDVAAYKAASYAQRNRMIHALAKREATPSGIDKGYYEVAIINTNSNSDMKDVVELRRELIEKGMRVNTQVFSGKSFEEIMPIIKSHYAESQSTIKHQYATNPKRLADAKKDFSALVSRLASENVIEYSAGDIMNIFAKISSDAEAVTDLFDAATEQLDELITKIDERLNARDLAYAENYAKGAQELSDAVITLIEENEVLAEEEKRPMIQHLRDLNGLIGKRMPEAPSLPPMASAVTIEPPRAGFKQSAEEAQIDRIIGMMQGPEQVARIEAQLMDKMNILQGEDERPRVKVARNPEERLRSEIRSVAVLTSGEQAPIIVDIDKRLNELQRTLNALDRSDRDNKLRKPRFAMRQLLETLSAKAEMPPHEKQKLLDSELKRIAKQINKLAPELDPMQEEAIKGYQKKYKKMINKFDRWARTTGKDATVTELMLERQAMETKLNKSYLNHEGMSRLPLFDRKKKADMTTKQTLAALMQGLYDLKRNNLFIKLSDVQLSEITADETISYTIMNKATQPEVMLSDDELLLLLKSSARLATNYAARGQAAAAGIPQAVKLLNNIERIVEKQQLLRVLPDRVLLALIDQRAQLAGIEALRAKGEKRIKEAAEAKANWQATKPPKVAAAVAHAQAGVRTSAAPRPVLPEEVLEPLEVTKMPVESLKTAYAQLMQLSKADDYGMLKAIMGQLAADLNDPAISVEEKQKRVEICHRMITQRKDEITQDVSITHAEKRAQYLDRLHRMDADFQKQRHGIKEAITLKEIIDSTATKRANLDRHFDVARNAPGDIQRGQLIENAIFAIYASLKQMATDPFSKLLLAVSGNTAGDKARVQALMNLDVLTKRLDILASKHTSMVKSSLTHLSQTVKEYMLMANPDLKIGLDEHEDEVKYIESQFKQLGIMKDIANDPELTQCKILIREAVGVLKDGFKVSHISEYNKMIAEKVYEAIKLITAGDNAKATTLLDKLITNEQKFIEDNILTKNTNNAAFNQNAAVMLDHFANAAYLLAYLTENARDKKLTSNPDADISTYSKQIVAGFRLSNTMRDRAAMFHDKLTNDDARNVYRHAVVTNEAAYLKAIQAIGAQRDRVPALNRFGLHGHKQDNLSPPRQEPNANEEAPKRTVRFTTPPRRSSGK